MSGIFRKSSFTDKTALDFFLQHTSATILSTESSHSIIVLLTLNEKTDSPYAKIYFDIAKNSISVEDVNKLVLKIAPIDSHIKKGKQQKHSEPIQFNYMSEKFISSQHEFDSEVVLQKLAFYSSYMVDFQMRAITPNVIVSFLVNHFHMELFSKINVTTDVRKERYEKPAQQVAKKDRRKKTGQEDKKELPTEIIFTHDAIFRDFLDTIKNKNITKEDPPYTFGCVLMEYLNDSKDFGDFKCANSDGKHADLGNMDDYLRLVEAKKCILIALDKCLFIGIDHNDAHMGNIVSYTDENTDEKLGCLIDFGKATYLSRQNTLTKKRQRVFNELPDEDEDIPLNKIYKKDGFTTGPKYNTEWSASYLNNLLQMNTSYSNGAIPINMGAEEWCDRKTAKATTIIHPNSYKYIPANEMNEYDQENVKRGVQIKKFLLGKKDIQKFIKADTEDKIEMFTKNTKNGGNALLKLYILSMNLDQNCVSILENQKNNCIDDYNVYPKLKPKSQTRVTYTKNDPPPPLKKHSWGGRTKSKSSAIKRKIKNIIRKTKKINKRAGK